MGETVKISDLMVQSGVKFGTSGARGLADDMTDRVCYAYTAAFIQYLEETGELKGERDYCRWRRPALKHRAHHDGSGQGHFG